MGKHQAKCGALSTSTIYLHKYKLCVNLHETQVRRFPCLVSKWLTLCCSVEFLNKEEKADIYLLNPICAGGEQKCVPKKSEWAELLMIFV